MDAPARAALTCGLLLLSACHPPALDPARVLQTLRDQSRPPATLAGALTEEQAVALAIERHPSLEPWRKARGVASGEVRAATAVPNPSVQLERKDATGLTKAGWQVELRWSPPKPWELLARRDAALAQVTQAEQDLAEQVLELSTSVRKSHASLVALEREVTLADAAVAERREVLKAMETRLAQGAGTRLDVQAAKASLAAAGSVRADAMVQRSSTRERLRALLSLPMDTPVEVSESELPSGKPPAAAALEDLAVASRPSLKATQARYDEQAEHVRLAKFDRLPWLRLVAAPKVQVQPALDRTQVDFGLELFFPVWNWNTGRIEAEEARLEQSSARYTAGVAEVRHDIAVALTELEGARATLAVNEEELLPALEARVAAAKEALKASQVDTVSLLLAEEALLTARRARERARKDYRLAWIDLERAVGATVGRSP